MGRRISMMLWLCMMWWVIQSCMWWRRWKWIYLCHRQQRYYRYTIVNWCPHIIGLLSWPLRKLLYDALLWRWVCEEVMFVLLDFWVAQSSETWVPFQEALCMLVYLRSKANNCFSWESLMIQKKSKYCAPTNKRYKKQFGWYKDSIISVAFFWC